MEKEYKLICLNCYHLTVISEYVYNQIDKSAHMEEGRLGLYIVNEISSCCEHPNHRWITRKEKRIAKWDIDKILGGGAR